MYWIEKNKQIIESFLGFYSSKAYSPLASVAVSSRVDPTVFLVNSATNLFKQFFSQPHSRAVAAQKCMRTQILNDYYCAARETKYPSSFISLGAYASADSLDQLAADTYGFLTAGGFLPERMRVRACQRDEGMLKAIGAIIDTNRIMLDERSERYDHTYGEGVKGRVVKLDYLSNRVQSYKNIGYLIAIYTKDGLCGAEFASSSAQILLRLNDMDYAVAVEPIADFFSTQSFEERRLADSIMGTMTLVHEGIHPNSSNTNGRTLKKYIAAIGWFKNKVSLSPRDIYDLAMAYYFSQYDEITQKTISAVSTTLQNALL